MIPLTIEGIDAAWLTEVLGEKVVDHRVVEVIHGSATKVRLELEYGEENPLPRAMVLKAGFDENMRALAAGMYANETIFYRDVAPTLAIPLPGCFYAGSDASTGQSALLLEDLVAAGASFGHIKQPLSVETAGQTLDLLAGMHASYWGRGPQPPLSGLASGVAEGQQAVIGFLLGEDNWNRCVDLGRFEGLPAVVHDRERMAAAILASLERESPSATCLHGDAHLGNMYFAPRDPHEDAKAGRGFRGEPGAPRFLDWQAAGPGRWEMDVAYFITCVLDIDERRAHERELLGRYVDRLAEYGVAAAPTPEAAWNAYRGQVPYGLLGLLCTPEMQSEEFSRTMGSRFAHAIDDLDAV